MAAEDDFRWSTKMQIMVQRIYDKPYLTGHRVLVDRLWPRGMAKGNKAFASWHKDIAPSSALRKWFAHDPAKWAEFQKKYLAELKRNKAAVISLLSEAPQNKPLVLLFSAKDETHNHALVLKKYLEALLEEDAYASPPCLLHESPK